MLDFLGIGAQKAGTTWLFQMLRTHPQLRFPLGKEAHYWNRYGNADAAGYSAAWQGQPSDLRCGEITPAYALLDTDTIAAIREFSPELRILFILRNPVERAWSSALMALQRAEMTYDEASDTWFADHFNSAGSIGRGDYEATLRRWESVFPADRIKLLRFEQLTREPENLLRSCAAHLDIDPRPFETLPSDQLHTRVFAGNGPPLPSRFRRQLVDIYRPRIAALADHLGEKLDTWLE